MSIKEKPLVSVLIPCFNHEKFIGDCLNSIIAQNYRNIEIIIFDDCSRDNSYNIVLSYQKRLNELFQRVVIKRKDVNSGVVNNLNEMIQISRGTYIKELASDDFIFPNAIVDLVDFAEDHPEYDVIYSNGVFINDKDHYPLTSVKDRKIIYNSSPPSGGQLTEKLCNGCFISAPTVLIRRDTFSKYGNYNNQYVFEDWEYWIRVSETGKIGYCDTVTVAYRVLEDSMSHLSDTEVGRKKYERFTDDMEKLLEKYSTYCTKETWTKFYNGRISGALSIHDDIYAKLLVTRSKKKGIRISLKTRIKRLLYKLGLMEKVYSLLKR